MVSRHLAWHEGEWWLDDCTKQVLGVCFGVGLGSGLGLVVTLTLTLTLTLTITLTLTRALTLNQVPTLVTVGADDLIVAPERVRAAFGSWQVRVRVRVGVYRKG